MSEISGLMCPERLGSLLNIHLILLLAYSACLILLGLWIGKRVKNSDAFFVAGRQLGPVLLFSTMLAANIGAGSTVGAAGLGFRNGLSAWWWVGSAGIGSILLGLWIGPAIWRIAKKNNLQTAGDYLEFRYNGAVRGIIAALLWVGTLAILAGQLIALSYILKEVAGIPKVAGCLIGSAVMTIYFAAGGLLASAWVNLLQAIVLLTGFFLLFPFLFAKIGGLPGLLALVPENDLLNFWRNGNSGWPYLFLLVPAFLISPGLLQKIFGAENERAVRSAVIANGVVLMIFAFLPALFGIMARILHPDLSTPELALPALLTRDVPALLGGLGLAAVFSAEISSADALLFMLATSLAKDLYKRFINPGADDKRLLHVARFAAFAGGALGFLLAVKLPTVIGALSIFYTILVICLFVPILAGLYLRGAGVAEAFSAIAAGILVMGASYFLTRGAGWGGLQPYHLGLLASFLAFSVVFLSRLNKRKSDDEPSTQRKGP